MNNKRYLCLQNGAVFEGIAIGADSKAVGELVFTTAMGYNHTLTDARCLGQIVIQAFPMSGNYGMIPDEFEGKCVLSGFVAHECCDAPFNFRNEMKLDDYLKQQHVPGIIGIDTRALTRILRDNGTMNAMLCDEMPLDIAEIAAYVPNISLESVSVHEKAVYITKKAKYNVTLVDYGARKSVISQLLKFGCTVSVLPVSSSAKEILDTNPDGIILSGGPGDPERFSYQIEQIKMLVGKKPIFAMGLGHQLLALALGAQTEKLLFGHHGSNQPAKQCGSDRVFITSQHHGFAVKSDSIKNGNLSFVNLNDGSCEGIDYPAYNAFSVQFDPDDMSGAYGTAFVFERLTELMEAH